MMRTTLDVDDAVLAAARALARSEGISLGAAVSQLARRGLDSSNVVVAGGFPVFESTDDARAITLELVNEYRDGE
jgi:predicted ATPase